MMLKLSDLWRWDGTIGRGAYAAWGLILMGVKYNADRALAAWFGRPWTAFSYLKPGATSTDVTHIAPADSVFYVALVLASLPFLWAGVVLTIRRLRAIGMPGWLVAWFFIPLANLFFFLVLAATPDRVPDDAAANPRAPRWLDRLIPHGLLGSGLAAVVVTAVIGTALAALAVNVAGDYGWGLFVGLPFLLGLNAALIHGWHQPRPLASCLVAASTACGLLALLLMAVAIEGVLCLAFVFPIALILALLGAVVGWALQRRPGQHVPALETLAMLLLALPVLMGAESGDPLHPPLHEVKTEIVVDAPPERVWEHVVSFSELPEPEGWIFKTGIAYPVRARIEGRGVGAVRKCEFSTGPFVEPITVWEPPTRLGFSVVAQPRPMKELTPYKELNAPHLDNMLRSERGQFLLTPLPGGKTRLEGTTWYRHRVWPSAYWQVWSDAIIHAIHTRVLTHVKGLSEKR